jgi:hypothetical protein
MMNKMMNRRMKIKMINKMSNKSNNKVRKVQSRSLVERLSDSFINIDNFINDSAK